jgi:hypothetical protein
MKRGYVVRVNRPEYMGLAAWQYASDYFPRKCYYLKDARTIAQQSIRCGATMARIEYPDGREEDFYPEKK